MLDQLYSFIFRGLLAEESLDKAGRRNKSIFSESSDGKLAERLCAHLLDTELVAKARKMSIVYTAICAFENSVRGFISKKLLEEKGEGWWEACVSVEIRKTAEQRKKDEERIRWHTARGGSMINYANFNDLIHIIQKKENWPYFEPHIVTIDWARQILDSLERSRNVIMHGGELDPQDIERIGTNIRDWIKQVG